MSLYDSAPTLRQAAPKAYIIAHKEDTSVLEAVLTEEGFEVRVNRKVYTPEEAATSAAHRCMLNHMEVWEKIASGTECALVLEADFVPVRNFGSLPSPVPAARLAQSIAWLYYGGGRLRGMDEQGYPLGSAPTTVGILCSPAGAAVMHHFGMRECQIRQEGRYSVWDVQLAMDARSHGVPVYLPFRSYGEHGGLPNPEHKINGVRQHHRADVLWGALAYLPAYARGSRWRCWRERVFHRCRGTLKFFAGRYIHYPSLPMEGCGPSEALRMTWFALRRFFGGRP